MRIEVVTITPAMAAQWLLLNTNNRKLRKPYVMKIKADIMSGKWMMTGDPIRFSAKRLIDGQHRLTAIAESGMSVTSVVMWDVPDEAYDRIDQNKTRSSSEILTRHGEANATACASVVNMLAAYEKGGASLQMQQYDRLTACDILHAINDEVRAAAAFANQYKIVRVLPASIVGTCVLLCRRLDHNLADAFFKNVATGEKSVLIKTSNATLLRDRLLVHAATSKTMTLEHKFTWCVRAWNAERAGVDLKNNGLKFVAGDPIPRVE